MILDLDVSHPHVLAENLNEVTSKITGYLEETEQNGKIVMELPVKFQERILRLKVKFSVEKRVLFIFLKNRRNDGDCLTTSIQNIRGKIRGKVEIIMSKNDCDLPRPGGGNYLMGLSDSLFYYLGCEYAVLSDESWIKHPACDIETMLIFIRCFQGKIGSWYSKFGFLNKDEDLLREMLTDLYHLDLDQIDSEVFDLHPPKVDPHNGERQTFGPYMARLWKIDCSSYEMLFTDIKEQTDYIDNILSIADEQLTKRYFTDDE